MNRLTDPASGYCEMYCKEYGRCFKEPETCDFKNEVAIYESLREYEATRMEAVEIRKVQMDMAPIPFGRFRDIMEAERDGRLVVPPCKIGAQVFTMDRIVGRWEIGVWNAVEFSVADGCEIVVLEGRYHDVKRRRGCDFEAFGVSAFLSREKAERALQAKEAYK